MRKLLPAFMRAPSAVEAGKANSAAVVSFGKNEESFGLLHRLACAIRAAWPTKPEKYVAHFTGKTERAVQFWLSASTGMSVRDVSALLRTEEGFLILDAIMGEDCRAEWWVTTKNAHEIRMTRKQIDQAQKRLDAARDRQRDFFDNL